jgi:hypothetical protein
LSISERSSARRVARSELSPAGTGVLDSPSDPRSGVSGAVPFEDQDDGNQKSGHLVGRGVLDSPSDPRSGVSSSRRNVAGDVPNLQIDLMSVAWAIVRPEHLGALTEVSRCLAGTGVLDSLSGLTSEVSGAVPFGLSAAVPFGDQDDGNQSAWGRSSPSECTCRIEHSI